MLSTIEILALVFSALVVVKLFFLSVKPKVWGGVVDGVYAYPKLTSFVALVLAAFVLNHLLKVVSITEIFAVLLFLALLMLAAASLYSKELINLKNSFLRRNDFWSRGWWYFLIWLALVLWVLEEIITK